MTIAYLQKIVQLSSIEEVWALHCDAMARYGFERLLYGFTRFKRGDNFGDRRDALILSNHSEAYLERYFREDHFRNGPMLRWCETHDGAISWSWLHERLQEGNLSPSERAVVATNREFGVLNGYTISFRSQAPGGFAAIGLTSAPDVGQAALDEMWEIHGGDILLMNRVMHMAVRGLPSIDANRLTDRQREVLEWVAKGKTIPEICALIGRKQATVEKHLRLAREAMNAQTTAEAVLKASIQNQIFAFDA